MGVPKGFNLQPVTEIFRDFKKLKKKLAEGRNNGKKPLAPFHFV